MNRDVHFRTGECAWRDAATLHLLGGLSPVESQAYVDHLPHCGACAEELELARAAVARVDLSTSEIEAQRVDSAQAASRVRERLLERIAREPAVPAASASVDRAWQRWSGERGAAHVPDALAPGLHSVAASQGAWEPSGVEGIEVKRLAVDAARRYVTMLVRMAPGTEYPGHRHAGAEECYVISGDIKVGERVLRTGDYQLAAAGSTHGVQSTEQGCTLFIVSSQDDELV
jgi:quercetin dioxygenase-like cupin family protein